MRKIGLMFIIAVMVFAASSFIGIQPVSAQSTEWAQVTIQNDTSVILDLYVDDVYAGRALSGMFCTTQVLAGSHMFTAKASNGQSVTDGPYDIPAGTSFTWTVVEEQEEEYEYE